MTTRHISTRRCTKRRWMKMRISSILCSQSPPRIMMNVSKLNYYIISLKYMFISLLIN
ncbi:hypothetical protein O3M35_005435 [Rhynocoris fuscipes]|uniref:Uncharacterized protein n=1 Tax=Rhynocoris fuscipes TaxID=488301 RepID=A0AAW1DLX1_9HEMI